MNVPLVTWGINFEDGISDAGKYVELIAHMDVLVLISNCPQLNNLACGNSIIEAFDLGRMRHNDPSFSKN